MKTFRRIASLLILPAALAAETVVVPAGPAVAPEWSHAQEVTTPGRGLHEWIVPLETADAAAPGLIDLRLWDETGTEMPYFFGGMDAEPARTLPLENVTTTLETGSSRAQGRLAATEKLARLRLLTPAAAFLKAVDVEGSEDGRKWFPWVRRQIVFRQADGAENMEIVLPPKKAKFLRLVLDDGKTDPIPVTGVWVATEGGPQPESLTVEAKIMGRSDGPGETRLTLELPYRHMDVRALEIDTPEPVFARNLRLSYPVKDAVDPRALVEMRLAGGPVYRLNVAGEARAERLTMEVGRSLEGRQAILTIENGDSPPLEVKAVRLKVRAPRAAFWSPKAGPYRAGVGNPAAKAPRYDMASLRANLMRVELKGAKSGPIYANPAHKPAAAPDFLPELGGDFTDKGWRYRSPVAIGAPGVQRLELSMTVLSRMDRSGNDLRLVKDGKQVPYIFDRSGAYRRIVPQVKKIGEEPRRKVSRWEVILPHAGLPVTHVAFTAKQSLFQRSVRLLEDRRDPDGRHQSFELVRLPWNRTGEKGRARLVMPIQEIPGSDHLIVEIENGDNAPLDLEDFEAYYRSAYLLFKASPGEFNLYYGNPAVDAPRYDITLAADALLSAPAQTAKLSEEEAVASRGGDGLAGKTKYAFWAVMALVAAGLLFLLRRLLPAPGPAAK